MRERRRDFPRVSAVETAESRQPGGHTVKQEVADDEGTCDLSAVSAPQCRFSAFERVGGEQQTAVEPHRVIEFDQQSVDATDIIESRPEHDQFSGTVRME